MPSGAGPLLRDVEGGRSAADFEPRGWPQPLICLILCFKFYCNILKWGFTLYKGRHFHMNLPYRKGF